MSTGDVAGDGESQSHTLFVLVARRVEPAERSERLVVVLRRDARAVVIHGDFNASARGCARDDLDMSSKRRRIGHQIGQRALDRVGPNPGGETIGRVGRDPRPRARGAGRDALDQRRQRHRLDRLTAFAAREVEILVDHMLHLGQIGLHRLDSRARLGKRQLEFQPRERGAKIVLIRPAPVSGYMGPRSPALAEFDPFWKLVAEADIPVGMHASDSGYQRYMNEWEGITDEMTPFKGGSGFQAIVSHMSRPITDTVASLIGHGLCSRFPTLRFAPVENGSGWVRPLLRDLEHAYSVAPKAFDEDPVKVFKRNIYVHPFHEEDPIGLVGLLGADRVLFGSDYPHPEGLAEPLSFVDELSSLPHEDVAKIMGGNLNRLMKLDQAA